MRSTDTANWYNDPPVGPAPNAPFVVESVEPDGPILRGVTDETGRASVTIPMGANIFEASTADGYYWRGPFYGAPRPNEAQIRLAPPNRPSLRVKVVADCAVVPRLAQVVLGEGSGGMWSFNTVDRYDEVYFPYVLSGPAVLSFGYVLGEVKRIEIAPIGETRATLKMDSGPCPTTTTTSPPPSSTTVPVETTTTPVEPSTTTTIEEMTTTTVEDTAPVAQEPVPTTVSTTPVTPLTTTTTAPAVGKRSAPGLVSSPATSAGSTTTTTGDDIDAAPAGGGGSGRTIALAAAFGGPTAVGLGFAALRYRRRQPLPG